MLVGAAGAGSGQARAFVAARELARKDHDAAANIKQRKEKQ